MNLYNKYCTEPPNCFTQILAHPSGNSNRSVNLSIFGEHRFAFYYWAKWNKDWKKENSIVPDLITFDWHQDLGYPQDTIIPELEALRVDELGEVSVFAWSRLCPNNDDHILAAAYLNLIGDVWVVCRQLKEWEEKEESLTDTYGQCHKVRKFRNKEDLFEAILNHQVQSVYFDLDLDYFTLKNDRVHFTYMKRKDIFELLNPNSDFMKWLFVRIEGFTIALEPDYTGGILKSYSLLKTVNSILFDRSLINWNCKWKHLNAKNY